jgi:phosphoribosyl-ATP pyrophosphohydrolase/phosphoribosyl-AMP cyclohydrolase
LLDKFKEYSWLHIIDLDAAIGNTPDTRMVKTLVKRAHEVYGIKVRVGGGIRTVRRAGQVVKHGAEQVIIGSAAFHNGNPDTRFLRGLAKAISAKHIVIALDTEKGRVTIQGWRRRLNLRPQDVMTELEPYCSAFLCTDVDREGTMTGANLAWFRKLREATRHPIIAAGGIKTKREIAALEKIGMDAAVGMAMYKNQLA